MREVSNIGDRVLQLNAITDQIIQAMDAMQETIAPVCAQSGPCEKILQSDEVDRSSESHLAGALRGLAERHCEILRQLTDIDERIEL